MHRAELAPFDLILGTDLLYERLQHDALVGPQGWAVTMRGGDELMSSAASAGPIELVGI